MRSLKFFFVPPLIALAFAVAGAQPKRNGREMTLRQARDILVGKKVVIVGKTASDYPLKGYLYDWHLATESNGEYRDTRDLMNYISDSYQGKEAEVIAIQLDSIEKERSGVGGVNALGVGNTAQSESQKSQA
jgi:hypothetical protein